MWKCDLINASMERVRWAGRASARVREELGLEGGVAFPWGERGRMGTEERPGCQERKVGHYLAII